MAKTVQCNGHWDAQWLSPPLSPLGLSIPQYVSILISKGILSLRGQHSQSVIRNVSLKVFSFLFGDDQTIWWSTLICQLCHLVDYNKKQQNKTFTFGRFLNFMYFFPVLFLHILLLLLYLLSCHFWMCSWSVVTPFTGSCQVCAQVEPLEVLMALTSLGTLRLTDYLFLFLSSPNVDFSACMTRSCSSATTWTRTTSCSAWPRRTRSTRVTWLRWCSPVRS